jgi:hypothetical protein
MTCLPVQAQSSRPWQWVPHDGGRWKHALTSYGGCAILGPSRQGSIPSLSLTGWILATAYRLRRHLWLSWSLARWLGLLLLAAAVAALISAWPQPWPAIPLGLVLLAYLGLMVWAARRGYVRFEPDGQLLPAPQPEPLRKEEMVRVRASGWFGVEGRSRYYVDLEADLETVGTREHIVLGRVHPSRFMLLGRWPAEEWGWWYIFFEPQMIRGLEVGHLHSGPRPQMALRLVYAPDEQTRQTIYLAFDGATSLRRVWEDLLLDAPEDATPISGVGGM